MTRIVLLVALLAPALSGCGDDKKAPPPDAGDPGMFDKSKDQKAPARKEQLQKPG